MSTILPSDPSAESTTPPCNPDPTKPKQRSAFRRRAVRAAPAVIIAVIAVFFLLTRGSFESVESKVQSTMKKVHETQKFPMQVDSVTSLTGIEAEGDAIRYDYVVSSSVDPSTVTADSIRSLILPTVCEAKTRELLDADIKMKYAYTFEGSTKSLDFTVTKGECPTV